VRTDGQEPQHVSIRDPEQAVRRSWQRLLLRFDFDSSVGRLIGTFVDAAYRL
jgi:hypothetical protein